MRSSEAICRIGVFYDGSFMSYAQNYFFHEKKVGWHGSKSFINERLLAVVNYAVDINSLESDKDHKQDFRSLFRTA